MQKAPRCRRRAPVQYKLKTGPNTVIQYGHSFKEEKHMEEKSIREIVFVIFRAVTLAMGVAVVVLSCMGSLAPETAVLLLGIGLACAGIAMRAK